MAARLADRAVAGMWENGARIEVGLAVGGRAGYMSGGQRLIAMWGFEGEEG